MLLNRLAKEIHLDSALNVYWIAYSGGMDSHVLLKAFHELRAIHPLTLKAIHVHHGLNEKADEWALHCEHVCRQLNIEFHLKKIQVNKIKGESVEALARKARYAIFETCLTENDFLFTAHHQEDQAETVLLQLLRGAGIRGLSAMPVSKKLGKGKQVRPLLQCSRAELLSYANTHQLVWVEDNSNQCIDFHRNYIRHQVMPLLKKQWPGVSKTFSRTALHCAEAQSALQSLAERDLHQIQGAHQPFISLTQLLKLNKIRQKNTIRLWLAQQKIPNPSALTLEEMLRQCLVARQDSNVRIVWGDYEVRRYRNNLYVMRTLPAKIEFEKNWDLTTPLLLSEEIGFLEAAPVLGQGIILSLQTVNVRFRQGGEYLELNGCTHELKKLFQYWNVPPWQRDIIPLLFVENILIAVVGFAVADSFKAAADEVGRVVKHNLKLRKIS